MPTTTFFTAANTLYEPFVVPYAVAALHHNDDIAVEICVEDPDRFKNAYADALAVIARYFPDGLLIRGGHFKGIRGASPRFLETPQLRSEYTYIADIDILILDRDVTTQHVANMERIGLPYSNRLRLNKPRRLSGLHFTRTDAHYPLPELPDWNPMGNAEELLYTLVEAKGLPFPKPEDIFRPSHGIHLSVKRTPSPAPGAGPRWQTLPHAIDAYLALWEAPPWREAAEHFHPAYRALLLILEATLQARDTTRRIYRKEEAYALWARLAVDGVAPAANAEKRPLSSLQEAKNSNKAADSFA